MTTRIEAAAPSGTRQSTSAAAWRMVAVCAPCFDCRAAARRMSNMLGGPTRRGEKFAVFGPMRSIDNASRTEDESALAPLLTRFQMTRIRNLGCQLMMLLIVCLISAKTAGAVPSVGLPVRVTGPLPVPVNGTVGISGTPSFQDADNPGRHPFQARLCLSYIQSCLPSDTDRLTVPSDRRYVVEFVSGTCSFGLSLHAEVILQTTVGTVDASHEIIATPGVPAFVFSQLTKIYADPGSKIELFMFNDSGIPPMGSCTAFISGYFIAPP